MARMTNHPRRARDDAERDAAAADALAGELEPAGLGDIPPQGSAEVPAHTGNGTPPGLRPNAAKIIGEAVAGAVAQALGRSLPQAIYSAFGAALSQFPVQAVTQQHMCATCIIQRIAWENAHKAAMDKAIAAAKEAAAPGGPQPDLAPFLPEALRPGGPDGIPDVAQAVTTFQGAEACPAHLAQAAGIQPGRSPLLVATATMNPAMLAGIR
jgi:hypothetical protein